MCLSHSFNANPIPDLEYGRGRLRLDQLQYTVDSRYSGTKKSDQLIRYNAISVIAKVR